MKKIMEIEDVIWSNFCYWHLNWTLMNCELKFKKHSKIEFDLNSKEF
jgi:hypothetical protein